jgi:hypothetical protein
MRLWAFFLESLNLLTTSDSGLSEIRPFSLTFRLFRSDNLTTSVVLVPDESDLVLLCGLYGDTSKGDLLEELLPGLTVAALESTEQVELIDP